MISIKSYADLKTAINNAKRNKILVIKVNPEVRQNIINELYNDANWTLGSSIKFPNYKWYMFENYNDNMFISIYDGEHEDCDEISVHFKIKKVYGEN